MATILIKQSDVVGKIPTTSDLAMGELALNTSDGKLFFKNTSGTIQTISGGGSAADLKTINGELITGTGNIVTATVADLAGKANTVHTHIATQVAETADRIWMTPNDRSQISANVDELASHSARIAALEAGGGGTSDNKVKMTADGVAGYLADFVDGDSVVNFGGKLTTVGIAGMTATVAEINQLQGVTGNIQSQIDALTSIGNFKGTVDTYADLSTVISPAANDMVIVLTDETHGNAPSIYLYTGTTWEFAGEFAAGTIRNFTTDPINLATETTGVLPKNKMERFNSSEVALVNSGNNFVGSTVEEALNELFTYANNIKTQIAGVVGYPLSGSDTVAQLVAKIEQLKSDLAAAITGKGVATYSYNTLGEMAIKIQQIASVILEGELKKTALTPVTAPYQLKVVLEAAIGISDVCAQLIEYLPGAQNVTHFEKQFTNGNGYDAEGMTFVDGKMMIRTVFALPMTAVETTVDWVKYEVVITKDILEITV